MKEVLPSKKWDSVRGCEGTCECVKYCEGMGREGIQSERVRDEGVECKA